MTEAQATTLRRLLDVEPGWATVAELTFGLEPDSSDRRSDTRRALGDLARTRALEVVYVRHRGAPLLCIKVDHLRITALLADELQQIR